MFDFDSFFLFCFRCHFRNSDTDTHQHNLEGGNENGYYCCARVCIMQLAIMPCVHVITCSFLRVLVPVCSCSCVCKHVCLHNKAVETIRFAGVFIKQRLNHSLSALNLTRSMGNSQTWGSIRFANNHWNNKSDQPRHDTQTKGTERMEKKTMELRVTQTK